jgi:hypothetical protein
LTTLFRAQKRTKQAVDNSSDFNREVVSNVPSSFTLPLGHLQDRFFKIAITISLYPISLIIANGIITTGDLYISARGGVKTRAVYGLYCVYYFLYGGRGIIFAMVSASRNSTD